MHLPLPKTNLTAQAHPLNLLKYGYMIFGLAVLALGVTLTIEARLGLASWGVLHQALENLTPLTFGQATQLVGLCVIVVGWSLGVGPRLATFLNMALVGWFIDLFRVQLGPGPESLVLRGIYLVSGVAVMGLGIAMYLSADLGAGPRDTLMIALVRRTGWPVSTLRSTLELGVMVLGWLLGGPVGVGTVVGLVLLGPAVQVGLRVFARLEEYPGLGLIIHVPLRGPKAAARPLVRGLAAGGEND